MADPTAILTAQSLSVEMVGLCWAAAAAAFPAAAFAAKGTQSVLWTIVLFLVTHQQTDLCSLSCILLLLLQCQQGRWK